MDYATPPTLTLDSSVPSVSVATALSSVNIYQTSLSLNLDSSVPITSAPGATYVFLGANTIGQYGLATVVARLMDRAGFSSGQYDVSGIQNIVKPVRALATSQVAPARSLLEMLMSTYFFEMTVSDKVYFRPRAGTIAATIPYDDLGASTGDQPIEHLPLTQHTDIELPAQVAITYSNTKADYQTDTQISDRLVSTMTDTIKTMTVPMGMTPEEAKGLADSTALDQAASLVSSRISLSGKYAALEPTDVINVTGSDGSTYRLRLIRRTDSFPLLEYEVIMDDSSVVSEQGIASVDYSSNTDVSPPVTAVMSMLDIPILRDSDSDSGFYTATKGSGTPYAGANIYSSVDDVTYSLAGSCDTSAVIGVCINALGSWTGPRVIDESNYISVNVGTGVLLNSSTRWDIINDGSINAALVGDEIIQFHTAVLVTPGVYKLTGLLRGCRGTERAMATHLPGDRFVQLQQNGMTRIAVATNLIGVSRYYKAVTFGRSQTTATAVTFTDNAVGLKPYSPVNLRASRDGSSNITFTWQRRTRFSARLIGTLGVSIPLAEDSEAYDVQIYSNSSYTTLKRTITATSPTAAYSAADQTTDFGGPQSVVYARVYQRSALIGLGFPLEASA